MPLIEPSSYHPPFLLRSGNLLTLWGSKLRRFSLQWEPFFTRIRLETPDGDFIDVDKLPSLPGTQSDRLVILSHGLEGNSRRKYMRGMAEAFRQAGWDVLARNFRGCSGEENRTEKLYHSGETDDLHCTVLYAASCGYTRIVLVGFSMGGCQTLKYLGENPARVPAAVIGGIGISVPCDLEGSAERLALPSRKLYMEYFLRTLRQKIRAKASRFPDSFDPTMLSKIHTFNEFDELYTAPLYGFASARDYWRRASCAPVLAGIKVPSLIVNAADDPFLSSGCFPRSLAMQSRLLTLEIPVHGGHVGFVSSNPQCYWSESRAVEFAEALTVRNPAASEAKKTDSNDFE